ncbi:metal-dependent phosphohydrolase [Spirulina subsalsa FACHB-351]|uniref:Metal-dependent phosphohydrolase n=1 Tax=Spirulina subsalsa FACHB-351 TaxID=234711 RepID=A0ABT3L979_9CYAN|nr:DICT sensory domain-containing protein [Spirulina subsalsa]MCW6038055.1 metal-dependent phosphohydrolase [Spirulina subsalsa FACHB-351]
MRQGSILQKLVTAHEGTKRPLHLGVYYKNTLVALCHALEDFILQSDSAPVVIAAFQQGKWYLEEANRYGELADKASQIAILATLGTGFGEHSTSRRENVALVSLQPDDPVAQEWHLMILSPTYSAMVLCQELSEVDYGELGQPEEDLERKFYGFWTFETELVRETVELAIAHIGQYKPQLQQQLGVQVSQILAQMQDCQRDDLNQVVSQVVDYLHRTHQQGNLPDAPRLAEGVDDNLLSNEMQAFLRMAELIDRADALNPNGAAEVAALGEAMGQLLDLPAWQVKRLRLAALLHRLAPLTGVMVEDEVKSKAQLEVLAKRGILPKASVLRIMPQLEAIANIIIHQTEAWDGSGQPDGLSYDGIPLESRIIALMAYFQKRCLEHQQAGSEQPLSAALADCQAQANRIFDPKLVEALELLKLGIEQGMSLSISPPRIAAGIWLIE